jgi:hypothetical protein
VKSRGHTVVTDPGEICAKIEYLIVWAAGQSFSDEDHL